jgi:hypothetical protein
VKIYLLASAACAFAVIAVPAAASSLSITVTGENTTLPAADFNPSPSLVGIAPLDNHGTFTTTAQGSIPLQQASPWSDSTSLYSCIDCSSGAGAEAVTYDAPSNAATFSILWGSPDAYNAITFVGVDGSTTTLTGANLGVPTGQGFDFVTFTGSENLVSVELYDNGTPAFEYADPSFMAVTPLPATLPMLVGGFGLLGLLGRRRKRTVDPR